MCCTEAAASGGKWASCVAMVWVGPGVTAFIPCAPEFWLDPFTGRFPSESPRRLGPGCAAAPIEQTLCRAEQQTPEIEFRKWDGGNGAHFTVGGLGSHGGGGGRGVSRISSICDLGQLLLSIAVRPAWLVVSLLGPPR